VAPIPGHSRLTSPCLAQIGLAHVADGSTAVFSRCRIYVRLPPDNGLIAAIAQGPFVPKGDMASTRAVHEEECHTVRNSSRPGSP